MEDISVSVSFPRSSPPESIGPASPQLSSGITTPVSTSGESTLTSPDTYCNDVQLAEIDDYIALGCLVVDLIPVGLPSPPSEAAPIAHELLSGFNLAPQLSKDLTILLNAKWIRMFSRNLTDLDKAILRIYILPQDVGRSRVDRFSRSKQHQIALEQLLVHVDVSRETWNGSYGDHKQWLFDANATPEDSSLFYIYNTLPSPSPNALNVKDRYARLSIQNLLDTEDLLKGLKTKLYPYQARSAASMLQRETAPDLMLDPRLELRESPDGETFYYGPRDATILKHPRLYDSVRGGILSETMGLG